MNGSRKTRFAHSADHQSVFRASRSDPIAAQGSRSPGWMVAIHRNIAASDPAVQPKDDWIAEHQQVGSAGLVGSRRRRIDLEREATAVGAWIARHQPDDGGPTGVRTEAGVAPLDGGIVIARRTHPSGGDPPRGGLPDRSVAAQRVAHDRADLAREATRSVERVRSA